jgi:competence protein ComEA
MFRRIVALTLALFVTGLVAVAPALAESRPTPAAKVNLNTATVDQLTELPGVGPTLAARIVEYREKAGRFRSPQELMNVKGIGEKSFKKIEPWLSVGETRPQATSR